MDIYESTPFIIMKVDIYESTRFILKGRLLYIGIYESTPFIINEHI